MANNPKLSDAAAAAAVNAIAALLNSGTLEIYDGTQPTNANTAVGAQNKLATMTFGATAFATSANNTITANAITSDADAALAGTPTWFRAKRSAGNGSGVVFDGSVGTASADMILAASTIVQHAVISCTSLTVTFSEG